MAGGRLMIGEQCVDREAKTEEIGGQQFESVTARVLLHALDAEGQPVCGYDAEPLTAVARPWHAGYLPHLPRCTGCLRSAGAIPSGELPAPAARVAGIDIRLAAGTAAEIDASIALGQVLVRYDLRRWLFTDLVTIDESIFGGFSHPLTLNPRRILRRPATALADFLHEQLHWVEGPGTDPAIAEASQRWPDPPSLWAAAAPTPSPPGCI